MNAWIPSSPPGGNETWRFVISTRTAPVPIGISLPEGYRPTATTDRFPAARPPDDTDRPRLRRSNAGRPTAARRLKPGTPDPQTMADSRSIRGLLWNDDESRPRAPWRLALAVVLLVAGGVGGFVAASGITALTPNAAGQTLTAVLTVVAQVVQVAGFVAGLVAAAVLVDRRYLADMGLRPSPAWWADLAFGLALGVALPALVFALEFAAGFLRVTGTFVTRSDPSLGIGPGVAPVAALALTLGYFVGVGVFEEVFFRGYLLPNVAEGLDGWLGIGSTSALAGAAVVSGLAFGVGHGLNPNVTALALANIALFGGLFAASYLLTERIAVAIGLHVTWNFSIASVFGFPVSGFTTPVTVVAVEQSGPALVTGGSFGPEGGLVALLALVVGVGALGWWVRWREGSLEWRVGVASPSLRGRLFADESAATGQTDETGGRVEAIETTEADRAPETDRE
ncbi:CPBP family intramembrane metalloprotease domain-containing protein [Halobacteriales archaeon QH_8_67_27]|nr:MAG: CPBP family intramembrane metalloprotease domain-containing protein [Halobacteriales archaeon QH_8_67_27]